MKRPQRTSVQVNAVERAALEIARAVRRLDFTHEQRAALRAGLLLAGQDEMADQLQEIDE